MKKIYSNVLFLLLIILMVGCASTKTQKAQFENLNAQLMTRDYAAAIQQLEAAKEKGYTKKDRVVYYLDLGMLYHFDKQYAKSNEYLTNAEQSIEDLYTKSISKMATSILLNDNALEYSGEDYEDIYLNVFKALNYIALKDFEAGFVEIRKVNNKLDSLEDKYKKMSSGLAKVSNRLPFVSGKNKFHNSALARYLSMLLYSFENEFDEARIDKKKLEEAFQLQTHIYKFSPPKLTLGPNKGKATLNFISFTGNSPDKKAKTLYIHTEKDKIYIANSAENKKGNQKLKRIDEFSWEGTKAGYHFKFQLPYLEERKSHLKFVRVKINGEVKQELTLIEDISKIAIETYDVKKPLIYTKSIVRALMKGWAAEKTKAKLNEAVGGGLLGKALSIGTDMSVDATENADLRISRLFPSKAMVGEIILDPGTYKIEIEYLGKDGHVLWTNNLGEKTVTNNSYNLFESYYLY